MVHSTPLKDNSFFGHGWLLAITKETTFYRNYRLKKKKTKTTQQ